VLLATGATVCRWNSLLIGGKITRCWHVVWVAQSQKFSSYIQQTLDSMDRARALSFDLTTSSYPDPVGEYEMIKHHRSLDAPGALVRIVVAA
jgi:hypothetical protein